MKIIKKAAAVFLFIILTSCSGAGEVGETPLPPITIKPTETVKPTEAFKPTEEVLPEPAPSDTPVPVMEETLSRMTVQEKIGQLIISRVPSDYAQYIDDYHVGGFILFGGDIQSKEQLINLTESIRETVSDRGIPLLIAVDEEGGRVSRIGKLYGEAIPPMLEIGNRKNSDNAYEAAIKIGGRLTELGINMDFAPVADVWSNPSNTVIGDRAFSSDFETAAQMTEAAVRGFSDAGVLSVVKHFPGHGETSQDSHFQIAVYPYGRERFDSSESVPFLRGIEAGADGVMVGHIATPLMQNTEPVLDFMLPWLESGSLPATFSDYWMKDVLRDEFNYDGLIITDGLEMGALTKNFTPGEIALGAFMAGADILLIPPDVREAFDALNDAYDNGLITDERLDASVRRILRVKFK